MHDAWPVVCPPLSPPRPWTRRCWSPACPGGCWRSPPAAASRWTRNVCCQGYCTFQKPLLWRWETIIFWKFSKKEIHRIQIWSHNRVTNAKLPFDFQKPKMLCCINVDFHVTYHWISKIFQIFVVNLRPVRRFCVPQAASIVNCIVPAHLARFVGKLYILKDTLFSDLLAMTQGPLTEFHFEDQLYLD